MRNRAINLAGCVATLLLCGNAKATLTSVGPFTGNLSETWESFPNYNSGPLANPTTIMSGRAKVSVDSGAFMYVYEPSVAPFTYSYGPAQVSDGSKGMGINFGATATISFLDPISDFGAYWVAAAGATVSVLFSDGSSDSFVYTSSGVLEWHGWHSTINISSVSYSDGIGIDGLQANTVVPEPSTYVAGALMLLPFSASTLRILRKKRAA